ncbi:YfbM family protein [Streptomyces sp. NK15101]|uniref:YfbM family protein n=1 Tax=Streptomyces sp. NK15101 TaxID=2873261 RepID=UPI001CECDD0C|nr:YfbM family protein [Streptomyces sp. NK15101]
MYLQALPASAVPADQTGCDALFDVEFDELRRRVLAGEAVWLTQGFFQLNEVYWPRTDHGDCELPVFSGRHIEDPGGGPGHTVLAPEEVARAAAFLERVSFPALWGDRTDADLRDRLAADHEELRAFYGRAAARGLSVLKHFSF